MSHRDEPSRAGSMGVHIHDGTSREGSSDASMPERQIVDRVRNAIGCEGPERRLFEAISGGAIHRRDKVQEQVAGGLWIFHHRGMPQARE